MQVRTLAHELLYLDAATCKQLVHSADPQRDARWHTRTCTLGFDVMAMWPRRAKPQEVVACDRSPPHEAGAGDALLLAAGRGTLRLLNFPCVAPDAGATTARAQHAGVARPEQNLRPALCDAHS